MVVKKKNLQHGAAGVVVGRKTVGGLATEMAATIIWLEKVEYGGGAATKWRRRFLGGDAVEAADVSKRRM